MTTESFSWSRVGMALLIPCGLFAAICVAASMGSPQSHYQPPSENVVQAPPVPSEPDHYYQFRQGKQYGYTDDSGSGIVNFIQYEGQSADGRYILKHYTANGFAEMSCQAPCDLVLVREVHIYSVDYMPQTAATVNPQRGTVLWAMIQDLMNGKLER